MALPPRLATHGNNMRSIITFDVQEFHGAVLLSGSVLEENVNYWIAAKKAKLSPRPTPDQ
jgi:hypothetical protein